MTPDPDEKSRYATASYSQEGEDILLRRTLHMRQTGFYVDVGAHHPFRFSNTFAFYERGWSGINIDANPETKRLFDEHRPRDKNLHCLISEVDGQNYSFDLYNEPALNSAISERRKSLTESGYYKLEQTIELQSKRLSTILKENLSSGQKIDFMSVDVEGLDLQVLRSNDWSRFRPDIVIAETYIDLNAPLKDPLVSYMRDAGYKLRSFLHLSAFFVSETAKMD